MSETINISFEITDCYDIDGFRQLIKLLIILMGINLLMLLAMD